MSLSVSLPLILSVSLFYSFFQSFNTHVYLYLQSASLILSVSLFYFFLSSFLPLRYVSVCQSASLILSLSPFYFFLSSLLLFMFVSVSLPLCVSFFSVHFPSVPHGLISLLQEPSMAMRLQGRAPQEDSTSPPAVLPFPLLPCTAPGDREGETGGRPWREWRCSYPDCGYVTDRESWLRQHVRKHTGEKPFACPLCPFRSAQKGNVNVHIRRVHYGGVMPVSSEPPPAATTSVAASSPTASAAAPKVNMQWFMKGKVQGAEFSKSQNGVCQ